MKLFNQRIHFFITLFFRHIVGFQYGKNIFFHRHFTENRRFLGQITDTVTSTFIYRELRDLHIVQKYLSFIRSHQSYRHIEGGRFPGSVRPQQSHDLPLLHINRNMIHNGTRLIFLNEVFRTKHHLLFVCHIPKSLPQRNGINSFYTTQTTEIMNSCSQICVIFADCNRIETYK